MVNRTLNRREWRIGRKGQSAVFDAVIFFIILTSASIFIYIVPSNLARQNEELLLSQYRTELVDNTLKAVLKSTMNSTHFEKNGEIMEVNDVDVRSAIHLYMELRYEMGKGLACNLTEMMNAIGSAFRTAIPSGYDYSLNATYTKGETSISDIVSGEIAPRTTRYAASSGIDLGSERFLIILSIWN